MASVKILCVFFPSQLGKTPIPTYLLAVPRSSSALLAAISLPDLRGKSRDIRVPLASPSNVHFNLTSQLFTTLMSPENQFTYDVCMSVLTAGVALSLLRFWDELAKRGIFDQKLNRKLVHISIGLVFMLFWPIFSSGHQAAYLAAVAPGVNIIRMLLMGLGIVKNEAMVKSMSRHNDYRELLKGPLYYACTITLATAVFWRTSPIAIATICNLCAGDGLADVVGRRFGIHKLPYNNKKSFAGSVAMALAGFLASAGYMYYFSLFGFVEGNRGTLLSSFLVVSLASTMVESLPVSTLVDDNLTVPLTCIIVGSIVFS